MKLLLNILVIICFSLILYSCKQTKEEGRRDVFWDPKIIDEPVELKTSINQIENEINNTLSSKSIVELFGAGSQTFPIEIMIDKDGKFNSLWIEKYKLPLLEAKLNYLISNSEFIEIFKKAEYKPAKYKEQYVGSLLYLDLMVTIDNKGKIISPWKVKELKVSQKNFANQTDNDAYTYVEQMPEYPGGVDALLKFISQNVKYPEVAKRGGVEGKVLVQFIVDEKGNVIQPKVLKGIGYGCDEEALRVIKSLPRWKSGKQGGKPVKVKMVIPFNFKLN